MANELITCNRTFKVPALAAETENINKLVSSTVKNVREIAISLAKVSDLKEPLKAEGFTGVGDYAKQCFGFTPSYASQLVKVAKRFYLNPSEAAEKVSELAPATLYMIADVPETEIAKAVNDGKLTNTTTQAQAKEFHDVVVKPKAKIVKRVNAEYWIVACFENEKGELRYMVDHNKIVDKLPDEIWEILEPAYGECNRKAGLVQFNGGSFGKVVFEEVKADPENAKKRAKEAKEAETRKALKAAGFTDEQIEVIIASTR